MKLFLDTNVILDFVLCRDGEPAAADILQQGEDGKHNLCVSYLTMANVAYVARKHRTREELYDYLSQLASMLNILPNNEAQYLKALAHPTADF